ncbi:hypothetical protein E2C01_099998 [Portunus trituberculatus]|uniref:Uncharacterized protein n=1 Tax=Portunus trituberculatus TaxID=210409 RepID=A0A5B7KGA4_PORTR|nr:hypothetical protein [Portunus trituberculatus]
MDWDGECARFLSSGRCPVSGYVDAILSRYWSCVVLLGKTRVDELPLCAGMPGNASVHQVAHWLSIMQGRTDATSLLFTAPCCPHGFLASEKKIKF